MNRRTNFGMKKRGYLPCICKLLCCMIILSILAVLVNYFLLSASKSTHLYDFTPAYEDPETKIIRMKGGNHR